jgi:hypothetical protein
MAGTLGMINGTLLTPSTNPFILNMTAGKSMALEITVTVLLNGPVLLVSY